MKHPSSRSSGANLLTISRLHIEGRSDDVWHPIVSDVSLEVHRGEIVGIIGESGAGKSTIGLAALGFVRLGCRVTGGSVVFDGIDLFEASEDQRRLLRGSRIAYVAQSAAAAFNPAHRIIEQTIETALDYKMATRADAESDARGLFAQLKLPHPETIGARYPHQLSGGQLQRAMTAMAMSCRPELIVFDEPTTALDVTTQVDVLAAMRDLVKQFQTAAIYITHDLAVVSQMADRILVLRHGKAVEEAPTRQMLQRPAQEYTKTLWAVRKLASPERAREEIILSVRGIYAKYGGAATVLRNINMEVPRGRTVAVVGESGSGKSSLARTITGLLPPTNGEIYFNGTLLAPAFYQRSKETLRRIQMIYQSADTSLNPRQRVADLIGRPLQFYRGLKGPQRDKRVLELLHQIELDEDYLDRLPSELSGGQKQRISIARALAAEPDVIICDEVTSALDQIVQEEILKLLLKLQREQNLTYLFITHDIATVRAIADEIVVMHQAAIVQQGSKSEVLNPPHPAYTELLLSSVPQMNPNWLTDLIASRARSEPTA